MLQQGRGRVYGREDTTSQSAVRDILKDAISSLGGYQADVFNIQDVGERLSAVHKAAGEGELDLARALDTCVHAEKIRELVVNEKSSLRELTIAVLMTHWDFIAPVFFYRGNALMASKKWANAVEDFKMCLHRGYSQQVFRVKHKIGTCHVKLKQYKAATVCFTEALELLSKSNEAEKIKKDFTAILHECIKKFGGKADEPQAKTSPLPGPLNPNSTDPRISGNVEILEEVGKGRTAFARTLIPIGSIVAMDEGEGTHLNPESPQRSLQYCLECMGSVSVAFPCSGCPRVVFCSRECGEAAEASHHRIPCALDLQSLRGVDNKDGMTIFTCLRLLLQHPATFWLEHQAQLLLPSPASEWPTPNKTDLERMKNVFYMATNANLVERETDIRHTMITILLLRLLRGSDYYSSAGIEVPTTSSGPFKEEELVMGKLLYRLRLVQDMNAHPIWGVEPDPRDCSRVATHNIGGGFYSAIASYFNSDCNPNTVRINMGRKMFLVATRNIKKGEEVTDNYCAVFSELGVSARKQFLRENFLFSCECEACEEEWPTYSQLPASSPSQKVADKLCEYEMDNMEAMGKGEIDKALSFHCKEISLIQNNLSEPHQLLVNVKRSYELVWWQKVAALMSGSAVHTDGIYLSEVLQAKA